MAVLFRETSEIGTKERDRYIKGLGYGYKLERTGQEDSIPGVGVVLQRRK